MKEHKGVWTLIEHKAGELAKVSLELLGVGRYVADELGTELAGILLGEGVSPLGEEAISYGADKVYLIEAPELKRYETLLYCPILKELILKHAPEVVLFGGTPLGSDLAPRLACALKAGLSAHCVELRVDKAKRQLIQICPFFNYMASIVSETRPQMAMIQPGVMPPPPQDPSRKGKVIKLEPPRYIGAGTTLISIEKVEGEETGLEEAEIVVGVGRGVKKFELAQELAQTLGGALGATMPVVDAGFLPESRMIGQTGKKVKPKLYIACGISGAGQHVVGMQDSEVIVAINKDENAPIFKVADYGILGDVHEVLPALTSLLREST